MRVDEGFVMVMMVAMMSQIHVSMSWGVGLVGYVNLVMMVDVLVHRFNPSWGWLRNRHPLFDLHWSPGFAPVGHVDRLGLPGLHPTWFPVDLLSPESMGRVLQANDSGSKSEKVLVEWNWGCDRID